jgi:hypothetical protein
MGTKSKGDTRAFVKDETHPYLLVAWQGEEEHAIGDGPMSEVLSSAGARRQEEGIQG